MTIQRLPVHFEADPKKVILLYLEPVAGSKRLTRFTEFVQSMSDMEADKVLSHTTQLFKHRHRHFENIMLQNADLGMKTMGQNLNLTEKQKLVLGSYLTKEYSVEAAALFNPSIVHHPDQSGLKTGETRFVLTLRSVGEGHISSVGFMEGIVDSDSNINFTHQGPWRTTGTKTANGDDDHYNIHFDAEIPLPERVIFPQARSESMGMEDLRMMKFSDGGEEVYFGTYTAYDGRNIQSKMLQTTDFKNFEIRNLKGSQVDNKGMAYFPRKINGKYVMLSRQGGESLCIMHSDDYMTWDNRVALQEPTRDFELVQIGNCGSPIETPEGWLMITHHVGPMRRYSLGVTLLDLDHPEKVIAVLDGPLMEPIESEREGYVPNVLYTCGWMEHGDNILIPYAMSDVACGFATLKTKDILTRLATNRI
ncbi:MAG: glycoside hydrolase family 130 protein [Bacteroidota bacterium]|nr:glycoside hydrolase family 130 protein [Bacteroidota bacterium]